jgi:hypothetical protein
MDHLKKPEKVTRELDFTNNEPNSARVKVTRYLDPIHTIDVEMFSGDGMSIGFTMELEDAIALSDALRELAHLRDKGK